MSEPMPAARRQAPPGNAPPGNALPGNALPGNALATNALAGAAFAVAAYGSWGFNPIYFKAVAEVPALEILCHRVVWSVLLIAGLVTLMRRWPAVMAAFAARRVMLTLVLTTVIIGGNWLLFIWATNQGHLLQVSLG